MVHWPRAITALQEYRKAWNTVASVYMSSKSKGAMDVHAKNAAGADASPLRQLNGLIF